LRLDLGNNWAHLTLKARVVLENTQIGDSIAVNGVCLTVTGLSAESFTVDIMQETLKKTNLHELKQHAGVNLERALQLKSRLGGHLVSGHIDGTGKITAITPCGIAKVFTISCPQSIAGYIVPKGSVALDGISLTVVDVGKDWFTVSLIPHTAKNTTLGFKKVSDTVNIETDLIGKYVARFLQRTGQADYPETAAKDISLDFLKENGFL